MFLFLPCSDANSQNELISLYPRYGMGYMAWKDTVPGVRFWRASIFKRTYDTTGTYVDTPEERIDVWNKNYMRIPTQYATSPSVNVRYLVTLTGHNAQNVAIASVDDIDILPFVPDGSHPSFVGCYRFCNGPDYAYRVQQYILPDYVLNQTTLQYEWVPGGSFVANLEAHSEFEPGDANNPWGFWVPKYEFMNEYHWNSIKCITNPQNPNIPTNTLTPYFATYHNTPDNWVAEFYFNSAGPEAASPVLRFDNPGGLTDANGFLISPLTSPKVVALKKAKGPWEGPFLQTNVLINPTGACGLPPQSWDNFINFNSNLPDYQAPNQQPGLPNLFCQGIGGIGDHEETQQEISDCWPNLSQIEDEWEIEFDDFVFTPELIQAIFEEFYLPCLFEELSNGNGGTGGIVGVAFNHWEPAGPEVVGTFSPGDLFNAEGEFVGYSLSLPPGLFTVNVLRTDGRLKNQTFELRSGAQISINQSHMFEATVFPVPIVGNSYSINMKAHTDLRVLYELYNGQGNRIYHQSFILPEGHDENHFIDPNMLLPVGILVHRFVFEDGSQKTITTVK